MELGECKAFLREIGNEQKICSWWTIASVSEMVEPRGIEPLTFALRIRRPPFVSFCFS